VHTNERFVVLGASHSNSMPDRECGGGSRGEIAKHSSRQAYQFVDCQHSHCFLHLFSTALIAVF